MNDFIGEYQDHCQKIKALIEEYSGIEDIGIDSHVRYISDMKKIYCAICREKTKATFKTIATVLRKGYNHASVINCTKKFHALYSTNQLLRKDVYDRTIIVIDEVIGMEGKEAPTSKVISEYITFLNWFRKEAFETTPIDSSFYVGKYFSNNSEE